MRSLPLFLAAASAMVAVAAPAAAQLTTNPSAPIAIDADDAHSDNKACIITYTGNVEALQDNARMRTDLLKVFEQPNSRPSSKPGATSNSCGDLIRIEAHGSVYYVNPQERVHGDDAVYEASDDTLTVTGKQVVAVQDKNVITGTRMVFNNQTGEGHMVGETTGRNKPDRVRTVIYPKDKPGQNGQASGAASAPPAAGKPR